MENFLLIAVLGVAFALAAGDCDFEKVSKCLGNHQELLDQVDQGLSLDEEELGDLCKLLSTKRKCVEKIEAGCSDDVDVQKIISALSAISVICGDSAMKQKYLDSRSCALSEETLGRRGQCAVSDVIPGDAEANCRNLQQTLDCIYTVLSEDCGAGAAEVFAHFYMKSNSYLTEPMDCALNFPGAGECDIADIRTCLEGHTEVILRSSTDIDADTLAKTCNAISTIRECLVGRIENCRESNGVVCEIPRLLNDFEEICASEDLQNDFLTMQQCTGKQETTNALHRCGQQLKGLSGMPDHSWCSTLKKGVACGYNAVEEMCGSDAANAQRDLSRMLLIHITKMINCDLYEPDE